MSKQRDREIRERLEDLKLKVGQTSGYEVTSSFHLTAAQIERQRNEAEFRAMQQEEAEQVDQQRKSQRAFRIMSEQWSKPIAYLTKNAGMLLPDVGAELPLTDKTLGNVQEAFNDFLAVLKTRDQALSRDGQNRLILYMGSLSNTSRVIDGVTYRVASDNINSWIAALNRLIDFDAFSSDEYAALLEAEQPQAVEETAENLREQASSQWMRIFEPVYRQWLASLAQAPWNFVPDEDQQRAALRFLEMHGTGDALAFDNCRIAMSDAGIFPALYTADDIICKKLEAGAWDLSTPAGRSAYARAKNQVHFGTIN
jgi:hypothetical protein